MDETNRDPSTRLRAITAPWWVPCLAVGMLVALVVYRGNAGQWWLEDWRYLATGACIANAWTSSAQVAACLETPASVGFVVFQGISSALLGSNPVVHHILRLLMLVAITILVGGVAWRWTWSRAAAALAAGLFALMPAGAGVWGRLYPSEPPALLAFVGAVWLLTSARRRRIHLVGATLLSLVAGWLDAGVGTLCVALAAYLWIAAREERSGRVWAATMAAGALVNLVFIAPESAVGTAGVIATVDDWARLLVTGLMVPAWFVLSLVVVVELFSYRQSFESPPPAHALVLAIAGSVIGWTGFLLHGGLELRMLIVGMVPAAWLVALLWPLLPRGNTASRILAPLVLAQWLFQLAQGLPMAPEHATDWSVSADESSAGVRAAAGLPAGSTQLRVLDDDEVARVLACAGRPMHVAARSYVSFTLGAALIGARLPESVHQFVVYPRSRLSGCEKYRPPAAAGVQRAAGAVF